MQIIVHKIFNKCEANTQEKNSERPQRRLLFILEKYIYSKGLNIILNLSILLNP